MNTQLWETVRTEGFLNSNFRPVPIQASHPPQLPVSTGRQSLCSKSLPLVNFNAVHLDVSTWSALSQIELLFCFFFFYHFFKMRLKMCPPSSEHDS